MEDNIYYKVVRRETEESQFVKNDLLKLKYKDGEVVESLKGTMGIFLYKLKPIIICDELYKIKIVKPLDEIKRVYNVKSLDVINKIKNLKEYKYFTMNAYKHEAYTCQKIFIIGDLDTNYIKENKI